MPLMTSCQPCWEFPRVQRSQAPDQQGHSSSCCTFFYHYLLWNRYFSDFADSSHVHFSSLSDGLSYVARPSCLNGWEICCLVSSLWPTSWIWRWFGEHSTKCGPLPTLASSKSNASCQATDYCRQSEWSTQLASWGHLAIWQSLSWAWPYSVHRNCYD